MTTWLLVLSLLVVSAGSLPAEETADAAARRLDEAFLKAAEAGDLAGVMALYADDAEVIWPGLGEEARGKKAIEPLAREFLAGLKSGTKLVLKSVTARRLGPDLVVNSARWEEISTGPDGKPTTKTLRTTEISTMEGDKRVFLVDHASIGWPPTPPPAGGRPADTPN
jgi:uncharacterized protein (TIGR02246 family)